ncbi:MAG: DUF6797 domain-containing protein [Tepidisphaerales bacterium]
MFSRILMILLLTLTAAAQPTSRPAERIRKYPFARWLNMDYGPVLSLSFTTTPGAKYDNITGHIDSDVTPRGKAVRLADEWNAGVVFDADTMRISAGWTGRPLAFKGVAFDGAQGPTCTLGDRPAFVNPPGPGWAGPKGSFDDPRDDYIKPLPRPGPLPRDWARYRGLYRHDSRVIFSYDVLGTPVLESWSLAQVDRTPIFVRHLTIARADKPLIARIAQVAGATTKPDANRLRLGNLHIACVGNGAQLDTQGDGQAVLRIAAHPSPLHVTVILCPGGEKTGPEFTAFMGVPPAPEDLTPLTKGAPPIWPEIIETRPVISPDNAPYVTDRIPLPENNPWDSWMRLTGLDFFTSDPTKAAICTQSGDVWIVSGLDRQLKSVRWKRFAAGLHEPLGLRIVNDAIYVAGKDQITRLVDLNHDGEADFYESFSHDWHVTTAYHTWAFDLQTDRAGNFYTALGAPIRSGGIDFQTFARHHGTILKISPDGAKADIIATGLRAPNGMSIGPDGTTLGTPSPSSAPPRPATTIPGPPGTPLPEAIITVSDNEGSWAPAGPLFVVNKGDFLGVPPAAHGAAVHPPLPLCFFPQDVDNSCASQTWVTSKQWGPFEGQMLHLSYGASAIFKVMPEKVDGVWQGGVVKFPVRFTSSAMRGRFNPADGQLYVVGLRGWQSNAVADGGFDRIRYTGQPVIMPTSLNAMRTGMHIGFTAELDPESAGDADNYSVETWDYRWTEQSGSAHYNRAGEIGHNTLAIKSAKLDPDRRGVLLELPDIRPSMQMKIAFKIRSAAGQPVIFEIHNTIHKLP